MKAIETKYRGINFRSRKEARWAVFMDEMKIKWVYEPEAYDLDGLLYLPDFWLPELGFFYEIKPEKPTHEESLKAMRLVQLTKKQVFIEFNYPSPPQHGRADSESAYRYSLHGGEDHASWWVECPECHALGLSYAGWNRALWCGCNVPEKHPSHNGPRLTRAYEIAQSKSFWSPRDAT
jgi:hypothetical protein